MEETFRLERIESDRLIAVDPTKYLKKSTSIWIGIECYNQRRDLGGIHDDYVSISSSYA